MGIFRGSFLRRNEDAASSVDIACELFCRGSENRIERASKCPLTFPIMHTRIMQNIQHRRRNTHQHATSADDSFCGPESREQHYSDIQQQEWSVFSPSNYQLRLNSCGCPPFDYPKAASWLKLVLRHFKNEITTYKQIRCVENILEQMHTSNIVAQFLLNEDSRSRLNSVASASGCYSDQISPEDSENEETSHDEWFLDDITKISHCIPRVTAL